jgi:tetraacyldisaccharide 4'-kinase
MTETAWRKISPLLLPLTPLYSACMSLRNTFYDRGLFKTHHLSIPVVSVGNVTVGGTGKTPVTLSLAQMLRNPPYKTLPAILSRGYGRKSAGFQIVHNGKRAQCDWKTSGDEPQIYGRRLKRVPVAVDKDRVRGGQTLIDEFKPSLLLLDDAFQHRRIHRDTDIVLLDCNHPLDEMQLLPAGQLRESLDALNRADFIVMTRCEPDNEQHERFWNQMVEKWGAKKLLACRYKIGRLTHFRTGEKLRPNSLKGKTLIGFCGIARPENFKDTLDHFKAEVPYIIRFGDHHVYRARDVERLAMAFNKVKADYLITTEKDAVKLGMLFEALPILIVEVEVEWLRGLDNLHRELSELIS